MTLRRSITESVALAAALVLTGAAGAVAQDRPLFEWRGRVDREIQIVMRGRDLNTHLASWQDRLLRDRQRVFSVLPREDGWVTVRRDDGRGNVDVVQQPNRGNDYTAVIRITDPRGGADDYRITAYWRPARGGWGDDNGWYGPGNGRGRDNGGGWGNDDGWNRGQDRDRDRDHDADRDNGGWNNGGWNGGNGSWNGGWNGGGRLHWSGGVDDQVEIRIQGNRVDNVNVTGDGLRDVRADLSGQLPRRDVSLHVDKREGRGTVSVVQQPSAWNNYTAVIRIRDTRAGMGYYDVDVTW